MRVELEFPTLILVAGVASSGKTTLSKELVRHIYDSFPIDKDTINNAFLLNPSESDAGLMAYRLAGQAFPGNSEHYHKHVRVQTYHAMLALARDVLRVGKHPVLDAPYVKEIRWGYLDEIIVPFFEGVDYRRKLVFCYADEETIRRRLRERGLPRDDNKLASVVAWESYLDEQPILPPELERYDHVKIDTTHSLETCTQKALAYITS